MLNETNASLAGTADSFNWGLVYIIIGLSVPIIALYPSFASHRREKKKDRKNKLEERRDLFYIPLQDALKIIDVSQLRNSFSNISKDYGKKEHDEMIFTQTIAVMFSNYLKEYDKINVQYSYLSTDKTEEYFDGFLEVYQQSVSTGSMLEYFKDFEQYYFREGIHRREKAEENENNFFNYYAILQSLIDDDIKAIKDELGRL